MRLAAALMSAAVWIGCGKEEPPPAPSPPAQAESAESIPQTSIPAKPPAVAKPFEIRGKNLALTTSRGRIVIELYADDAPKTVERILRLAESGFYRGMRFHRVEEGSLVQTGDPTGTGFGGSGGFVPFETNERKHLIGSVALARGEDRDSGDSQFYICLRPLPELDGEYVVFGRVIEGFGALTIIKQGDVVERIDVVPAE